MHQLKKYKPIFRFVGMALGLLFLWTILMSYFPSWVYEMHYQLVYFQTEICAWLLGLFFEVEFYFLHGACLGSLRLANGSGVCIGSGCSGLELFLIFAGFLLIYQGQKRKLWWFLPLGLCCILILNIIRISLLAIINNYYPEYLDFNHKYTFVLIVYGAIFGLWLLWINKLSVNDK